MASCCKEPFSAGFVLRSLAPIALAWLWLTSTDVRYSLKLSALEEDLCIVFGWLTSPGSYDVFIPASTNLESLYSFFSVTLVWLFNDFRASFLKLLTVANFFESVLEISLSTVFYLTELYLSTRGWLCAWLSWATWPISWGWKAYTLTGTILYLRSCYFFSS